MAEKQTAGRNILGEFASKFAELNDDVLFGQVWSREKELPLKIRSIITISALISGGNFEQLKYHLQKAKENGVTKEEISEIITHISFYVGWPKAWSSFNLAKEIWTEKIENNEKIAHQNSMIFPIGEFNSAFSQYFSGNSYLASISTEQVKIFNVTFEPKCRNNWHIHNATSGGGQILIAISGRGYYQEEGKEAIQMLPGDIVNIPTGVKHWHGATKDSWFSHLAIEVEGENTSNEWLEPVSDEVYGKANEK